MNLLKRLFKKKDTFEDRIASIGKDKKLTFGCNCPMHNATDETIKKYISTYDEGCITDTASMFDDVGPTKEDLP